MSGRRTALDRVPGLAELSARQDGVASRRQLRALGVHDGHVASQVAARRWRPLGHAVVMMHLGPVVGPARWWAAVLEVQQDHAVLGGLTALEGYGLTDWPRPLVAVLVPRGTTPSRLPGVVVHETRRPFERVEGPRLPPMTTASRAVVDAGSWERWPRSAAGLVLASVRQRVTTADALVEELATARHIRHLRHLRAAALDAAGGAQALSEVDMAPLLSRAGLPPPRRQVRRRDADGRTRYIDLEVELPDGGVLSIEVDGAGHLDERRHADDLRRHNALVIRGARLLHFTAWEIRHDPDGVVAQLRAIRLAATPSA